MDTKIKELEEQIAEKENELSRLSNSLEEYKEEKKKNILKTTGFDKVIYLLDQEFESSCSKTPQYLEFHRVFKREFTKVLSSFCKKIKIAKPNHFDVSGFFELNDGRTYYFSIGDLRWDKIFLIREAKSFEDYTGGSNNFIELNENFVDNLLSYLK